MKFLAIAVSLLLTALSAQAQVKGQDDPAFAEAMDLWLQADDRAALDHFAALARADNRAAQLFFGVLAPATWAHGHVTADMSRKERNSLLKAPGGLSGKNWLGIAAADTPLAATYAAAKTPDASAATGHALFEAGDLAGGFLLMTKAMNYGDFATAFDLALRPDALPLTRGMFDVFQTELDASARAANQREAVSSLGPVSDTHRAIWPLKDYDAWKDPDANAVILKDRGAKLATHEPTAPLAEMLRASCGTDTQIELGILQGLFRNYPIALLAQSPVEAILPSETYQSSPRFPADIARKVKASVLTPEWLAALPCTTGLE